MSHFEQLQYPGQYNEHLSACLWRWNTIYETYMRGKLTHQNDRVIALAGVADEIRSLLKTDYLAGLWRCKFEDQLTWMVKDPVHAHRAIPYRAPSWSWLAIDGEIKASEHTLLSKKIPKVLEVEVELANPDFVTGETKNGTIKANAHLQNLSWSIGETGEVRFVIGNDQGSNNTSKGKFELFWDTLPEDTSGTCYLFSVQLWASAYGNPELEGLALISTADNKKTEMCRIGAFKAEGTAVCKILQHKKCQGMGCKFHTLRVYRNPIPRAHENLSERYDQIRKKADSEKEEAERIKGELEESYAHDLEQRTITIV